MQPVDFAGTNLIIAKDQPPYKPLPAQVFGDNVGTILTCWELTKEDLERVLSTGRIWVTMLSFNKPLQPINLSVDDPIPPELRPQPVPLNPLLYKVVATSNRDDESLSDRVIITNVLQDEAQAEADRLNAGSDPDGMWYYKIRKMTEPDYVFNP